jgi:hypothetical protein
VNSQKKSSSNAAAIERLLNRMYGDPMALKKKAPKGKSKWDAVPEASEELLCGLYDFEITGFKVTQTNAEPKRKMYIAELVVTEPEEAKGLTHTEFFMVGTEEDPDGDDPDTLKGSMGAKSLRTMCNRAGVQMVDDDEELAEILVGETVAGLIDPPTKAGGRKAIKGSGWFEVGERDPEVTEVATKAKKKPAGKTITKKKEVEVDEEEADEEEEEAPPKKKAKVVAKKKAKDEDEEEEEEEEEESEDEESDEEEEDEEETERPAKNKVVKRGSRR